MFACGDDRRHRRENWEFRHKNQMHSWNDIYSLFWGVALASPLAAPLINSHKFCFDYRPKMRSYTKNLQLKRKNYKDWRPVVPIGAEDENFLNFEPFFWRSTTLFSFICPEWGGGHVHRVPTLNTLLSEWQNFMGNWLYSFQNNITYYLAVVYVDGVTKRLSI